MYKRFGKRMLDITLSVLGLLFFSPIFIVLFILVKKKLGEPVIFSQIRPGKNGKLFKLYKFRTMTEKRDKNGDLLPDEVRLTAFGKKLRDTSLDELPELFNILKGDMSMVGPRPLLVEYLALYNEEQRRRHEVRPGLTGLAQIRGRNKLSWEERFKLDVEYVDNISFWGDLRILMKTIEVVLLKKGIHSETSATMEKFQGEGK